MSLSMLTLGRIADCVSSENIAIIKEQFVEIDAEIVDPQVVVIQMRDADSDVIVSVIPDDSVVVAIGGEYTIEAEVILSSDSIQEVEVC